MWHFRLSSLLKPAILGLRLELGLERVTVWRVVAMVKFRVRGVDVGNSVHQTVLCVCACLCAGWRESERETDDCTQPPRFSCLNT